MTHGLIVRHEAEADIVQAAAWQESMSYGLGSRFMERLRALILDVARQPHRFPCIH